MAIDITLLKKLRDATFAPLGDCKQALEEANGDFDQAQEILRKKGILKAGKKAERETNEGIVKLVQKDGWLAWLKLLCETDFVAKNESFHELADILLDKILAHKQEITSLETVDAGLLESLNTTLAEFVGKLAENLKIWDIMLNNKSAYVYNHPGNKVASIIYYEGTDNGVAKELALQVAAMNPTFCSFDEIPAEQKTVLLDEYRKEMAASGKPANIIEQIVEGKLKKTLGENVLLEQEYIRDGSKKVKDILPADFALKGFVRVSI